MQDTCMTQILASAAVNTINAAETAHHLAQALGGSPAQWSTWLANDRKPSRVNCCLPQEPGPGRPRYNVALVDGYIADNQRVQPQAVQAGNTLGSWSRRRFESHISAMTLASGADQAAVLFVIPKPLVSFVLSAQEARQMAARFIKAADEIDAEANKCLTRLS